MVATALENAVIRLLKRRPFYGHLLLPLRRELRPADYAVGVTLRNGVPILQVDAERFAALAASEQEALLEHLLKHLLHLHPLRRRERRERLWDSACDLAINPGIVGLPPGALLPERLRFPAERAAEDYYALLMQRFALGNLDGDGIGTAGRDASGAEGGAGELDEALRERALPDTLDDHRIWGEADSTPLRLAEAAVRRLVQEAWRQSSGEVPGALLPLVQRWLAPPSLPWQQLLRQFIATAGRTGHRASWLREHRRFQHLTPGRRPRRELRLLVAVDVSDSTDQRPLREVFARELLSIAAGRASQITVLYAGSRIQRIETFRGRRGVAEVYSGGGYTDLRPAFAFAATLQPRPAALIYLTDGFGPAPKMATLPTLWVLTPDGRRPAPWGVELRLAIEAS